MVALTDALAYVHAGWAVFPLRRDKSPFPSCRRCATYQDGRRVTLHPSGECVHGPERVCHGLLNASTDPAVIGDWWDGTYPGALIAARVPDPLLVLDIDPRHDGHTNLADLQTVHGPLPETLTCVSGRGDGGIHLYYLNPGGKLTSKQLPPGIDLKTNRGYTVLPPSPHPATGQPYTWQEPLTAPAAVPSWLTKLLWPEPPRPQPARPPLPSTPHIGGDNIADAYTASTSWADLLEPAGWTCSDHNPDADGARWRHPQATHPVSATVRHGCLFVYSTQTDFPVTEPGDPHGLTRFRAYAILHHGEDLAAAARALRNHAGAAA